MPFNGLLIDATIISGIRIKEKQQLDNTSNNIDDYYVFTRSINGLATINSLFKARRGLRLKQTSFFMTGKEDVKRIGATPFIKKVALVPDYLVPESHPEAALIYNESKGEVDVLDEINSRIIQAKDNPKENSSILNWYKERPDSWFSHKQPRWDPILFNYYIRTKPKFIFNPTRGYSDNFYGLEPLNSISSFAWLAILNSTMTSIGILEQARNQGSGLAKLQLFEFKRAKVVDLTKWEKNEITIMTNFGKELIDNSVKSCNTLMKINSLISEVLGYNIDEMNKKFTIVDMNAKKPKNTF